MTVFKQIVFLLAALLLTGAAVQARQVEAPAPDPQVQAFSEALDLLEFGTLAVHTEGRLKSLDSFTSEVMGFVSGSRRIAGRSPTFTYLDMLLRPSVYLDEAAVFVRNKPMRRQISEALATTPVATQADFESRMAWFEKKGLISERLLMAAPVRALLSRLSVDVIKTARFVQMVERAMGYKDPRLLAGRLALVPPIEGDESTPWLPLMRVVSTSVDPRPAPPFADAEVQAALQEHWSALEEGWAELDAERVNEALAGLVTVLPNINSELYPPRSRLEAESWYFRKGNMTWIWMFYLLASLLLLLASVYRWTTARRLGLAVFVGAFGLQTFAVGLRWYVSQRWPNSNMFEAVTTAAWFGGCVALPLEWLARRTSWRNLFALGSAVASMVALMAARFYPAELTPQIGNMMPVLHDLWLYIHTNVIIASYCIIFMAAVTGMLYLAWRAWIRVRGAERGEDWARMGGAGALMNATAVGSRRLDAEPMLAMAGGGEVRLDEPQPVAAAPEATAAGGAVLAMPASNAGQVLDGVTMLLMEVSFVLLWAGIAMGAIWADDSWGRPWGWDPKEVFALNTFLIFAVLVHVRMKTRDKGFWTAVLAIVGAGVMIFNWVVINFVITGLHSYA